MPPTAANAQFARFVPVFLPRGEGGRAHVRFSTFASADADGKQLLIRWILKSGVLFGAGALTKRHVPTREKRERKEERSK